MKQQIQLSPHSDISITDNQEELVLVSQGSSEDDYSQNVQTSTQQNRYTAQRRSRRQKKDQGRFTNIIPNIVKKIRLLIKQQQKQHLIIFQGQRPPSWSLKAELILLCLKLNELQLKDKNLFIKQIELIFKRMIQFRTRRIDQGQRVQFHEMNREILIKTSKICLCLLQRGQLPSPLQIGQILSQLLQGESANQGSLIVQSQKINQGYYYILKQFSISSLQVQQNQINPLIKKTEFYQSQQNIALNEDHLHVTDIQNNSGQEHCQNQNKKQNQPKQDSQELIAQTSGLESIFDCLNLYPQSQMPQENVELQDEHQTNFKLSWQLCALCIKDIEK